MKNLDVVIGLLCFEEAESDAMPEVQLYWTGFIRGARQSVSPISKKVTHNLQKPIPAPSLPRSTKAMPDVGVPGHLITNSFWTSSHK